MGTPQYAGHEGRAPMLLEVSKAVSFLVSLLSMFQLLERAFFAPGTR